MTTKNTTLLKKVAKGTAKTVVALGLAGTLGFFNEHSNGTVQQYLGGIAQEVSQGKSAEQFEGPLDKKVAAWIAQLDLPPVEPTIAPIYEREKRGNIVLLDKYGEPFTEISNRSKQVPYSRISPQMILALTSTEDKRFYEHHGWDLSSAVVAGYNNALRKYRKESTEKHRLRGASTITIQLADILLENNPDWMKNKFREWVFAAELEQKYTKQQILTHYLNAAHFGFSPEDGQALIGVEAATNYYFGKQAQDLDIVESAVLVAMLNSPSRYGTHAYLAAVRKKDLNDTDFEKLCERSIYVLDEVALMCSVQKLTVCSTINFQDAKRRLNYGQIPFVAHDSSQRGLAYEYTAEVLDRLTPQSNDERENGERNTFATHHFLFDDSKVQTHFDPELQKYAREKFTDALVELRKEFPQHPEHINGGVVVIDTETGGVEALVGGTGIDTGDFLNRTTQKYLTPGSGFKPFVLLAAVQHGWTLEDTLQDVPRTYKVRGQKPYHPHEHKHKYTYGPITLEEALTQSINGIFVELGWKVEEAYPSTILTTADMLNIPTLYYTPATPLGVQEVTPLDFAKAYTIFANGGKLHHYASGELNATVVADVTCRHTTFTNTTESVEIMTEYESHAMDRALLGVVAHGTGKKAQIAGYDVRGKTGTGRTSMLFVGHEPLFHKVVLGFFASDQPAITGYFSHKFIGGEYAAPLVADVLKYSQRHN